MAAKIFLRKTSLTDYPGKISSVLFFSGCMLRCPWCHNSELVRGGAEGLLGFKECFSHLLKRRRVLGGVVFSGGEPCLQENLGEYIAAVKALALSVKLDTNGMLPHVL